MSSLEAEVFAVGKWNGMEFKKEDLNLIANAFTNLKSYHRVPIKFGHNDEQPMTDGQPALGWVDKVWVEGTKLMAKFVDIPDVVFSAIESKLYKTVSIELDMGVEHKGNQYPWVLSGVALLGADIPAVNVLADLQAYMGRSSELSFKKQMFFTKDINNNDKNHEVKNMSEDVIKLQEELHTLQMRFSAVESENKKLVQENTDLKSNEIKLKAKFTAFDEAEKNRKVTEQRSLLEQRLEAMVKDAKVAPYSRDEFMRDYDEASNDTVRDAVVFAVEKLEKTIESNPAYFGAQRARELDDRKKHESDKDPAQIVTDRTREFMAKHGEKSFAVAKTAVLQADPALAEDYTKQGA